MITTNEFVVPLKNITQQVRRKLVHNCSKSLAYITDDIVRIHIFDMPIDVNQLVLENVVNKIVRDIENLSTQYLVSPCCYLICRTYVDTIFHYVLYKLKLRKPKISFYIRCTFIECLPTL